MSPRGAERARVTRVGSGTASLGTNNMAESVYWTIDVADKYVSYLVAELYSLPEISEKVHRTLPIGTFNSSSFNMASPPFPPRFRCNLTPALILF